VHLSVHGRCVHAELRLFGARSRCKGSGEFQIQKSCCSHIHNLNAFGDVNQKKRYYFLTDFTVRKVAVHSV
jgi:hypothetical protein